MRSLSPAWLFMLTASAAYADQPQQVIRVGDGKAQASAVAAAPNGGALLGIDMTASVEPERRENANLELQAGQHAVAVAAYGANGRLRWSRALTSKDAPSLRALASAADGSSCAVGWYFGSANVPGTTLPAVQSAGGADAFALGLAPDGAPRWLVSFGGASADAANAAASAPDGGCYVAGGFRDKANFGGKALVSHGGLDAFVLRLDATGQVMWAVAFGGNGTDDAVALAAAPAGGAYVLLRHTEPMRIEAADGARDFGVAGGEDALVLRIDADGRVQATQNLGSQKPDHFTALAADAAGVGVVGYYSGEEDLKVGDRTLNLRSQGGADALVLRLDSALQLKDYTSVGGGTGMILPLAATYAPDGRLWAAGSITGSVRIGKDTLHADRTDGALLGFETKLQDVPRSHVFGGERGQQLLALAVSGDALYVAGVTSAVKKSEAEREREEALERQQRKPAAKQATGKEAAERARAEEEEREEARSRSQAVLLRYRVR